MPAKRKTSSPKDSSANLGFEVALPLTASRPQGSAGVTPASTEIRSDQDAHAPLRADYVLANPPFNPAWRGTNFAWVQHFIHHLALAA